MDPAIIIISSDFEFVTKSISRLTDESFNSIIERSLGSIDFEILLNELINENIRVFSIILDESTPMSDKIDIQNCLNRYESQIYYNFIYGLECADDLLERI